MPWVNGEEGDVERKMGKRVAREKITPPVGGEMMAGRMAKKRSRSTLRYWSLMGKPVAGQQKRKMRKRVAREKCTLPVGGEMMSGRIAKKRSRSTLRDVSNVETAASANKMKGKEKGGQDLSSCSKSDPSCSKSDPSCSDSDELLRRMFDEWAIKYNKKYRSKKEREKRFKIFCSNKERIDEANKIENVFSLNDMSDVKAKAPCGVGPPDWPLTLASHEDDIMSTDEDTDDLKEERIEFEKWAERHGRKYSSEAQRTSRFRIFLDHKRLIDGFIKANHCSCSTGGYDMDDMDMTCWEVPSWYCW